MDDAIATGFFRHGTEILLVRSDSQAPDWWDAVSVPADGTGEAPDPQRVASAAGYSETATLVRDSEPIVVESDATERRIYPYLFECETREPAFEASIATHEWVQPPEILDRETVPGLWNPYRAVAPSIRTVREDTDHGAGFVSLRALETLRDRAAVAAEAGAAYEAVAETARELRCSRPSMGVIKTRIDRVMASADRTPSSVRDRAMAACRDAVRADRAAAERAASLLGGRVLTLSRSGTVRSTLEITRPDRVFLAESRPAREGIDVAERLVDVGIDVTVLVDAAIESLLASGVVETVLVGADTVLADGSVVNKVGTRTAMRAGNAAGIDTYAVCSRDKIVPGTTFDPEPGPSAAVYEGDADLAIYNPTFERVPPTAVSGVVTEDEVYSPDDIESIAREHASYRNWDE